MRFGEIRVEEAEGAILAHSVRHARGAFKKGRVLTSDDAALLAESGIATVFVARLDADDVPENEAAGEVARVLAGDHCLVQAPFTGRANVHARTAGVALIEVDRVRALNRLHESLTLATVPPFDLVEDRQMLATVKVIPFAVPRAVLSAAVDLIGERPLVSVSPMSEHRAGLVVTTLPQTKEQLVAKTEKAVRDRLAGLGSTLGRVIVTPHRIEEIGRAVAELKASGHDPILVFGASAIVDRGDVVPQGVVVAGGEIVHLGMPVDPGNLLMLGRVGEVPVVGVPSCARSPKVNGFDWVLPRLLAGLEVKPEDIMDMGAGGLLKEIPSRPSPRERTEAAPMMAPNIAAIVLAAGLSSRMRGSNKLLQPLDGKPMIRRTVEAILQSQATPVIVVTGHQPEAVRENLADLPVTFVHNPDYANGLATSLKTGIVAVTGGSDGALVCLGDMPFVTSADINRLIAAFSPPNDRLICVPTHSGQLGNPVLWSRQFFGELLDLQGDIGAKSLFARHGEVLVEVPMPTDSVLRDVDTREAFETLTA